MPRAAESPIPIRVTQLKDVRPDPLLPACFINEKQDSQIYVDVFHDFYQC